MEKVSDRFLMGYVTAFVLTAAFFLAGLDWWLALLISVALVVVVGARNARPMWLAIAAVIAQPDLIPTTPWLLTALPRLSQWRPDPEQSVAASSSGPARTRDQVRTSL